MKCSVLMVLLMLSNSYAFANIADDSDPTATCTVNRVEVTDKGIILHGLSVTSIYYEKIQTEIPKLVLNGGGVGMDGRIFEGAIENGLISTSIPEGQSLQSISSLYIFLEKFKPDDHDLDDIRGSDGSFKLRCNKLVRVASAESANKSTTQKNNSSQAKAVK